MPATNFIWSKICWKAQQNPGRILFYQWYGFVEPGRYPIFYTIGRKGMEESGPNSPAAIKKRKAIDQLSFQNYQDTSS